MNDLDGNGAVALGERALDERAQARSVVQPRTEAEGPWATSAENLIYFLASAADEITPWGRNPKLRDRQLREFWPTENIFASALGAVCDRNSAFSWDVEGPPRTAARVHETLLNANNGLGWDDLMVKLSVDLYSQDNGAFIEVVRESDSPESPFIGLNTLDAARCWHTGIPEKPVLYQDRYGRPHLLPWYNVIELAEMPTPIETLYGLQYSALTRCLHAAQVIRNVAVYDEEKTGGRHTRALHVVGGMSTAHLQQALNQAQVMADNVGMRRFVQPPIVGMVDPAVTLQHIVLDFVSLPEQWNTEERYRWYLTFVALAFGIDIQDLAPLPGGNLGSSSQSQILHLKSRGKGPAKFMQLIVHALNRRVLPRNVEFVWKEQDEEAEKTRAEIGQLRAETRKARIESGEITVAVAQQIAHDDGDLTEEQLRVLGTSDVTPDVLLEDDRPAAAQLAEDTPTGGGQEFAVRALVERLTRPLRAGEKAVVSDFLQTRIHKAFTASADDLAALGYMDTEGRIALSGVIGDCLGQFRELVGDRLPDLVARELTASDARLLLEKAEKALSVGGSVEAVTEDRLALDAEVARRLTPVLAAMRRDAAKRLRELGETEASERAAEEERVKEMAAAFGGVLDRAVKDAMPPPADLDPLEGRVERLGRRLEEMAALIPDAAAVARAVDAAVAPLAPVLRGVERAMRRPEPDPPPSLTEVADAVAGRLAEVVSPASDLVDAVAERVMAGIPRTPEETGRRLEKENGRIARVLVDYDDGTTAVREVERDAAGNVTGTRERRERSGQ